MSQPYRLIQVGTGGMGSAWCNRILPDHVDAGTIDVVAAVDIDESVLDNAAAVDVPPERRYTDVETAFAEVDADCCTVVVPPAVHEDVVDAAIEHDLHVLSEKPIAETLDASVRIADKVEAAGLKMGVTMSHRFRDDLTTLRRQIRAQDAGELDYIVARLLCSYREYGSWGAFRHDMEQPLLVDGAVHHLDLLADMAGGNCTRLYAETWQPSWGTFADDSEALVTMRFDNGVRVTYEGALTNASALNCWGNEYVRAECSDTSLVLSRHELERHDLEGDTDGEGNGAAVALDDQQWWGHQWLVQQFVDWLDGGEPMPTNVRDNLVSMALVEAAVESGRTGEPTNPQAMLEAAQE